MTQDPEKLKHYMNRVTHKIRVTVPVVMTMEVCDCKNIARAQVRALEYLADQLHTGGEIYGYEYQRLLELQLGDPKFHAIEVVVHPELEPEPEAEA